MPGLDREEIRRWYNGYNWTGEADYNPFDLLLFFDSHQFKPWWYETGSPSFLLELLRERNTFLPDLSQLVTGEALLSTFDVGNIAVEALLFQAGYLTIHGHERQANKSFYRLGYPNLEVFQSLNDALFLDWTPPEIRERGYDRPHREAGLEVICVGVEFSKAKRQIVAWDIG